jgi:hypothetical protein
MLHQRRLSTVEDFATLIYDLGRHFFYLGIVRCIGLNA